ncbi:MAG: hypothetical protein RXP99_01670 [Vulcanisaeta sp.]
MLILRTILLGAGTAPTAELLRDAERNKVLLEFAERANAAEIAEAEKRKLKQVVEVAAEVHEALEGVEHVFIKLVKPVRYVPADVDLLTSQPKEAAAILVRRGYRLVVREPYTITLRKNGINVDLYLHPSVGNIVFLRAERLRGEVRQADFHGVKLPALKPPAETALAIAHAVYKDGEVTLNDAVTYLRWREGTLEKCGEWKCIDAAGRFLAALHDVLTGRAPAPRPIPTWPLNAVKRALTHPDLAPSLLQAPKRLLDLRLYA